LIHRYTESKLDKSHFIKWFRKSYNKRIEGSKSINVDIYFKKNNQTIRSAKIFVETTNFIQQPDLCSRRTETDDLENTN